MGRRGGPSSAGEFTPALLKNKTTSLPEGVFVARDQARPPPPPVIDAESFTGVKDGAFAERDGRLFIRDGGSFEPANISAVTSARVRGMMAIRDAVRYVFKTQLDDAPEGDILKARSLLNRMYDVYIGRYGPLSSR